jgi:preprotein translocase subunit YajC
LVPESRPGRSAAPRGGLQGKITGLTETVATVEIAANVRVKVQRGYIAGIVSKGEPEE